MPNIYKNGVVAVEGATINENLLLLTPKSKNPAVYNPYQLNLSTNLVVGQQYTIQFQNVDVAHSGKTSAQLGIQVYQGGGMNNECSQLIPTGHADYLVATFTANNNGSASDSNNLQLNIYNSVPSASGTMNVNIERQKIEKGNIATPFSFAPSDFQTGSQGFIEEPYQNAKIAKNYVQATEFVEI